MYQSGGKKIYYGLRLHRGLDQDFLTSHDHQFWCQKCFILEASFFGYHVSRQGRFLCFFVSESFINHPGNPPSLSELFPKKFHL